MVSLKRKRISKMETKIKRVLTRMVFMPMVATVFALAVPRVARAAILNVLADYPTIQAAINEAVSGDTVQVAAGTYYEHITLKSGVIVQGAGADVTIIDGQGATHVVVGANNATLDGFTVTGGNATGSAYGALGGGMFNLYRSPTVSNCIFTGNTANYGGGMSNSGTPTVINCIFYANTATYDGGGMGNFGGSPTVVNCIFWGNTVSKWRGGGMCNHNGSSPTVVNCTFYGNSASTGGAMYNSTTYETPPSKPTVSNCILWGNTPGEIQNQGATGSVAMVTYSDVEGGYSGAGNIDADPLFVDTATGDYHLQTGSPCIDKGTNDAPDLPETDLDGNPRIFNGIVDMGAFECTAAIAPVEATIDIDPDTLNLKSKGNWITAYIELPEGYDVADIDIGSILLNGVPAENKPTKIGDCDDDGLPDLMVKFDRSDVCEILDPGDEVEITVTGELTDETLFQGSDTIRVIDKGGKK